MVDIYMCDRECGVLVCLYEFCITRACKLGFAFLISFVSSLFLSLPVSLPLWKGIEKKTKASLSE